VILPVFNGECYISEAIESVLAQTYSPAEILVVDDGSTDGTAQILEDYSRRETRVLAFRQENQGIGAARNCGVAHARGEYLAFLDADDLWGENKLEMQVGAFDRCPDVDIVFGHVLQFISPELEDEQWHDVRCPGGPMPGYLASTMLISRHVFHRVGLFDTSLRVGEFVHWYLRAVDMGLESIMLPDVVLRRRIHDSNVGRRRCDDRVDYVRVLKDVLDRRRDGVVGIQENDGA